MTIYLVFFNAKPESKVINLVDTYSINTINCTSLSDFSI